MEEKQILDVLKQILSKQNSIEFNKLAIDYVEVYATKQKRSYRKDINYIHKFLIPTFGGRLISEIKTGDIQKLHARISDKTPITANRVIEVLSKMFSLAIQWDYLSGLNPCSGVTQNKEKSRDRYLEEPELKRLLRVIESERVEVRAMIYLYLLTGRRKTELRELRWVDIDMTNASMNITDFKKDERISIPVPKVVIEMLHL